MTTTYYRDNAVHISSAGVRVGEEWFPLHSLTYIWHQRTGRLRHGGYMLATRGGAIIGLVGLLIVGGVLARRVDFSGGENTMYLAGGILGIILLGGIAAFSVEGLLDLLDKAHDHGRGMHEIWVRTDHGDRMIYSTTDAPRFGQIYRALQRAIEQSP